jgi:hypothetical protein
MPDRSDVVGGLLQLLLPSAKPLERPLQLFIVDTSKKQIVDINALLPPSKLSRSFSANLNNPSVAVMTSHSGSDGHATRKLNSKGKTCNGQILPANRGTSLRLDKNRVSSSAFAFTDGIYSCRSCCYKTENVEAFRTFMVPGDLNASTVLMIKTMDV